MAQLSPKPYPASNSRLPGENLDAYIERHNRMIAELTEKSNALPEGEILGALIKFQIADGYAMYVVIKEKPLTLQHLAFGDGYSVDPALIRGLRRQDILTRLTQDRAWSKLFKERTKKAIARS